MTSREEILYPVLPQAESTLDSTKLTIVSLSKKKKNLPMFFLFAIPIVYVKLSKQIKKILQFQKTNNANWFYGKKQVENLFTIFLSDSILLVYYR